MINSLIAKVTCTEDKICNYCIQILEVMSKDLGITYGQLNVYLFMVYMPLIIVAFMFLSIYNYKHKTKWNLYLTKGLIIFNILLFLFFVGNIPLI